MMTTTRKAAGKIPGALAAIARRVSEHTLPNGLKIRLLPNDAVPTCSFYTFFRVGSRNETPGLTGISHLFEHMMFNGAKRYGPGEFDKVLESNGGHNNAYTSTDLTVYHESFMAEALETVIDLESDRMGSLRVTPKILERERQVVLEERRMRVDNEVSGLMDEELSSLVWKAHPYRWPVIGWERDIEAISREACESYFRTFYAPSNATIYLVGDFEPKQALSWIKRYYGGIKAGPMPARVVDAEPEQKGERRAEVRHPAQAPALLIAWRGPKADHPDTLVLDMLQYALSVGQSSRLTRALVLEEEVAVSVSVDWEWRCDPGAFTIDLELQPGVDPRKAEQALYAQLQRVVTSGLSAAELEKAVNNLRAQLFGELSTNNGRAHAFGNYEHQLGHWRSGLELLGRYESITSEQIQAAAKKYLSDARRSVVTLVPTAEAAA